MVSRRPSRSGRRRTRAPCPFRRIAVETSGGVPVNGAPPFGLRFDGIPDSRPLVEQVQTDQTLPRLAAALPAGKARLDEWLAVAGILERSGDPEAARLIQQAIGFARSR